MGAMASTALNTIADQTTDTAALQRGLDLMTELRPTVFPGEMENWRYASSLGALRFAAANGYPVNLEPRPLVDYYEDAGAKLGQHYSLWMVNNFSSSDPRAQRAIVYLYNFQNPFNIDEAFELSDNDSNPLEGFMRYTEGLEEQRKNMSVNRPAASILRIYKAIRYCVMTSYCNKTGVRAL